MAESTSAKKKRALEIFSRLDEAYPRKHSALNWESAYELTVATILAAQCTDERVNTVTPTFFDKWPDFAALAKAEQAEVEEVIRSTGFFRNKAKNLLGCARMVQDEFGGEMPKTLKEMTKLPGIARKTANIVLSNAFGINEGIAVDTHVKRLSFRMGFTESDKPVQIEKDLMKLFADIQDRWGDLNHVLVDHGRAVCQARSPKCPDCFVNDLCPQNGVS
jgi:endonuclease-3